MAQLFTGKCDQPGCKSDITPATSQAQFNRNLGWHRRHAHGIQGESNTPEGRRRAALDRYYQKHPEAAKSRDKKMALLSPPSAPTTVIEAPVVKYQRRNKMELANGSGDAKLRFICPECQCRVYTMPAPK